jgi:hypothetical protein
MSDVWTEVVKVLRIGEQIAGAAAPLAVANPVVSMTLNVFGAGVGLAADLIEKGLNPIVHITRMRSVVRDFDIAANDLDQYARGLKP